MDLFLCVTVLLASVTCAEGVLRDITSFKDLITVIHNFYRSYERAADMKALTWDPYLQKRAEAWSENCYWDHQREGLGENLAYFWNSGYAQMEPLEVILKSNQNWWKEVNDWHWSTNCGQACHYTQMIWGSTERIGCALSKCSTLRMNNGQNRNNADFFVCFYDPPGNFVGRYPYTLGESCSKCGRGETCLSGLCSKPANYTSMVAPSRRAQTQRKTPRQSSGVLDKIRIQNGRSGASATYVQNLGGQNGYRTVSTPRKTVRRVVYRWTL